MEDFLFTINAVLPIILLSVLGYILKKLKLIGKEFLAEGSKITFKVLLPILLFYNVYNIESFDAIDWRFVLFAVIAILVIYVFAIIVTLIFTKDRSIQGVLIQGIFRSNYAIIGIPLATQLFGAAGGAAASVLSAFSTPIFNLLAVITLSVFNGNDKKTKPDFLKITKDVLKNPLIIGVVAGLLVLLIRQVFINLGVTFRLKDVGFLYTTLKYISGATTPVALIVLGGQFEFSSIKSLKKPIIFGTLMRTVVVPFITLFVAMLLVPYLGGECFSAYIALFCTPVAVASAIMAREMNCNGDLAGQLVVWTTIFSSVTLFVAVYVFRLLGVF